MKIRIGVDVGGTTIKFGFFNADDHVYDKFSIQTILTHQPQDLLDLIASTIEQRISLSDIASVVIGIPGPVVQGVVSIAVNLDWPTVDVRGYFLTRWPDVLVAVYNDATLAALGESAYAHRANLVLFTLGTGVGGGIIIDGQALEGSHGFGAELGHMKVTDAPLPCGCGLSGCLESIASATGLKRQYQERLIKKQRSIDDANLSAKALFEAAMAGDDVALEIVDEMALALAKAMQMVSVTVDPDVFLLGGGVAGAGEFLRHKVEQHYRTLAFSSLRHTPIELAQLGNDAGIYGALAVKHD